MTLNGYLWAIGHLAGRPHQIATVLVGYLVGAAILLLLISNLLTFAMPRLR